MQLAAEAVVGACKIDEWATPLQPKFLNTFFTNVLGLNLDFDSLAPAEINHVTEHVSSREARRELVDLMLAVELLAHPIPEKLSNSIEEWASALTVYDDGLVMAREIAHGSHKMAQADLYRHGYWGDIAGERPEFEALLKKHGVKAYAVTMEADPEESSRWSNLEHCPPQSLGRAVWQLYVDHGFKFPGVVGAANTVTAVHDWIHVLADYPPTGLGEIEVGAFRMSSSSLPGASLSFLGELGFWQSGSIQSTLTGWHRDAFSMEIEGGAEAVADAFRRGQECNRDFYRNLDFFDFKDDDLNELRKLWNILPKTITKVG